MYQQGISGFSQAQIQPDTNFLEAGLGGQVIYDHIQEKWVWMNFHELSHPLDFTQALLSSEEVGLTLTRSESPPIDVNGSFAWM